MIHTLLLVAYVTLSSSNSWSHSKNVENEWKLSKDKNGIRVYTRQPEGSNVKEFKAMVTVNSTVEKVFAILKDIENYPNWIASYEKSEILKKINDNEFMVYGVLSVPWPLSNRDLVTYYTFSTDATTGVATLSMLGKENYIPKKEKCVRVINSRGSWTLKPTEDKKVEITYQYLGDPAGGIPAWVVNLLIVDGPFDTLTNLKKKVE